MAMINGLSRSYVEHNRFFLQHQYPSLYQILPSHIVIHSEYHQISDILSIPYVLAQ